MGNASTAARPESATDAAPMSATVAGSPAGAARRREMGTCMATEGESPSATFSTGKEVTSWTMASWTSRRTRSVEVELPRCHWSMDSRKSTRAPGVTGGGAGAFRTEKGGGGRGEGERRRVEAEGGAETRRGRGRGNIRAVRATSGDGAYRVYGDADALRETFEGTKPSTLVGFGGGARRAARATPRRARKRAEGRRKGRHPQLPRGCGGDRRGCRAERGPRGARRRHRHRGRARTTTTPRSPIARRPNRRGSPSRARGARRCGCRRQRDTGYRRVRLTSRATNWNPPRTTTIHRGFPSPATK